MENRIRKRVNNVMAFVSFLLLCLLLVSDFGGNAWANPSEEDEIAENRELLRMRIGPTGTSWEEAEDATQEKPYEMKDGLSFEFLVGQKIPEGALEKFELRFILDECLIAQKETAVVVNQAKEDVTEQFVIEENGQQIIFTAKAESIVTGETYIFHVPAGIRTDITVQTRHFQEDGYTYEIPNGVLLFRKMAGSEEEQIAGEDAWLCGEMIAQLGVEQQVKSDCKPGDIVDYSVRIRQLRKGSCGRNLLVEAPALPRGLTLLGGATAGGVEEVSFEAIGKRGWRLTCPRLEYGETIVVVFQCKVDMNQAQGTLTNVVTASADNFQDSISGEKKTAEDAADIWINGDLTAYTSSVQDRQ